MVWYYCEFCNKNVQVSEGRMSCKQCGHLLYSYTLTAQERKRRDRERTTYCGNCDKYEYAVPIDIVLSNVKSQGDIALQSIKYPSKPTLRVSDKRYKSGYRLTPEGEKQQTIYWLLCFLTLITLGLALIPIGIYYYYKNKGEKEGIQTKLNMTSSSINTVLGKVNSTSEHYDYVCRRCYEGVKLEKKPTPSIRKKKPTKPKIYCELCGNKIELEQKFCENCGTELVKQKLGKNL